MTRGYPVDNSHLTNCNLNILCISCCRVRIVYIVTDMTVDETRVLPYSIIM